MVRMTVGVIALLAAAWALLTVGQRMAEGLKPTAGAASAAGTGTGDRAAQNLPQKVQQDVRKAYEQGQRRASEANE